MQNSGLLWIILITCGQFEASLSRPPLCCLDFVQDAKFATVVKMAVKEGMVSYALIAIIWMVLPD